MGLIGDVMSFPYMVVFFLSWIMASLVRPLIAASLALALTKPFAAIAKFQMTVKAFQYLAMCNDKKWKQPPEDPKSFFPDLEDAKIEKKMIVFVRHGESTWNDTFNKGDRSKVKFILFFIPNVFKAIFMEWYFFVTGQSNESWFYDSPLSEKGLGQALGVQTFLQQDLSFQTPKEKEFIDIMLGNTPSQLVSSNLRRAISTMAVGFQDRFSQKKSDQMIILPQLQEVSRNPDALCITPPYGKLSLAYTDPRYLAEIFENQTNTTKHFGNKPVDTNGLKRLQAFCKVAFEEIDSQNIVAAGHSLWFRSFFRTYLPRDLDHIAKKKKIVNGGCVGFALWRIKTGEKEYQYMVDPKSVTILHRGF